MLLGSVSSQQRFGMSDIKTLRSWTDRVIAVRQISVTAPFYLENSKRIHSRGVRACRLKDSKRREWGSVPARGREKERMYFGSSFYMFFSSPWAYPM